MAFDLSELVKKLDAAEKELEIVGTLSPAGAARGNEESYWNDLANAARTRLRDARVAVQAMQALSEGLDDEHVRSNGLDIALGALRVLDPDNHRSQ